MSQYTSHSQRLKTIEVISEKHRSGAWDEIDLTENVSVRCPEFMRKGLLTLHQETPLLVELDRLAILDLTLPFRDFQAHLRPLVRNLPIILNNVEAIEELFISFYDLICSEGHITQLGLGSVLGLHYAFYCTCGRSALPYVPNTIRHLMRLAATPALQPELVEMSFSKTSLILQEITSALLQPDSEATKALKETWLCIASIIAPGASKTHVRKCAAIVWAGVIRKARGRDLDRLLHLLLDAERRPGMEGIWVESLKGTSDGLHSRATFILDQILERLAEPVEADVTSVSKLLTAIVHHCSSKSLLPVVDVILARLGHNNGSRASSAATLALLTVLLATRKGKRFPRIRLRETMRKLVEVMSSWSPDTIEEEQQVALRRQMTQASVASLLCGQLSDWLSTGVNLIDTLWHRLVRFPFLHPPFTDDS